MEKRVGPRFAGFPTRLAGAALVAITQLVSAGPAHAAGAGEPRAQAGATGAGSTWRGDAVAWGSVEVGWRFADLIGPYGAFSEGYAAVDARLLTLLGIGAKVWLPKLGPVRPHARLGFLHQHEESLSVVAGHVGMAMMGMGDAIRHRGGGELGVGVDVPFVTRKAFCFYGTVDATARLFPDKMGPLLYAGGGLALGVSYDLGAGS